MGQINVFHKMRCFYEGLFVSAGNRVYSVDFTIALGYFSTPPTSNDQLFLLITDGRVTLTSDEFLGFQSAITASNFSNVEFSIYTYVGELNMIGQGQ